MMTVVNFSKPAPPTDLPISTFPKITLRLLLLLFDFGFNNDFDDFNSSASTTNPLPNTRKEGKREKKRRIRKETRAYSIGYPTE